MMKMKWLMAALICVQTILAQDTSVEVVRGRRFVQTGNNAPVVAAGGQAFYFEALATGISLFEPISNAKFTPPAGNPIILIKNGNGDYVYLQNFTSEASRDAAFPAGRYDFSATLNLLGVTKAHAILSNNALPESPKALNFDNAQAIDPNADFTLEWTPFGSADEEDQILLQVVDSTNENILQDNRDLPADTHNWTFYQGDLDSNKSFRIRLAFIKRDPAGLPDSGELLGGQPAWISETSFTIKTTADSTGTRDTTPPTLTDTVPANGTTLALANSVVVFTFSEPMDTSRTGVNWQGTLNNQPSVIDPTKFQYIWSDDHKFFVCLYNAAGGGWPAGVTVTWDLNTQSGGATNLRDAAGNELPHYTGTFLTAGGVDPCSNAGGGGQLPNSSFFFSKTVNYLQTGAGTATNDPILGAVAFGFFNLPGDSLSTTVVTLKVPTANPFAFKLPVLSPMAGTKDFSVRMFQDKFASRGELDDAYPAGTYQMELRNSAVVVTNSAGLLVSATGYPPIPHFSNFTNTQTIDATQDFSLNWDAYSVATTNSEFVSLNVYNTTGDLVFHAPDDCRNVKLAPNASGIVIPSQTLTNGQNYTAELTFDHLTDKDKIMAGVPGFGFTTLSRVTRLVMNASGGNNTTSAAKFTKITFATEVGLTIDLNCTPGKLLVLESAPTAGSEFTTLLTTNPPAATLKVTLPTTEAAALIRARNP